MPRFVILEHDHPFLHWDLLLEAGESLCAWRLLSDPNRAASGDGAIDVQPLPDHRRMYLDYEGPVSGGRGKVARWDAGSFDSLDDRPDRIELDLRGTRVAGRFTLSALDGGAWRFQRASD
jgi:hypothetical protein